MISVADATAFLDYFLDGVDQTDHAVLIDAPWGAGKTYFIKSYLQARDAAAREVDELIGAPFLYASLYGVSKVDEIREQFFAQAYPVLNSAPVKLIGTALAGVAKKFTGAEFNPDDLKPNRLPLIVRTLVFDDLERAAMPLVDALGLINSFVEHGKYKVIVIASQTEVPSDQRSAYEHQREKVIGRTLTVRADPSNVLPKLISEMRCEAARDAAHADNELIIRIFEASETHNLRSLRAAIADFDRLVGSLDHQLAECPEALRRLLSYVVAVEVELRTGLSRSEIDALMSDTLSFSAFRPSESREIKKARAIQGKYPEVEWRDSVIPAKAIGEYLVTGVLDVQACNQAIMIHPLIVKPSAIPAWRRLIAWQLRGANAFETDRADVLDQIKNYEIIDPGEICHVAGVAIWLEDLHSPLLDNVERDICGYIDHVEANGTLKATRSLFDGAFTDAWEGVIFCCSEHPILHKIKNYLKSAVARRFNEKMKVAVPDLMDQLRRPNNNGEPLYDGRLENGHYGGVAVLHHVPVSDFADLLLNDGCINRELDAALVRRYQYWGRQSEMLVERPWLETLEKELELRAKALGAPFERALKMIFSRMFSEIFGVLDFVEQRDKALATAEEGEGT